MKVYIYVSRVGDLETNIGVYSSVESAKQHAEGLAKVVSDSSWGPWKTDGEDTEFPEWFRSSPDGYRWQTIQEFVVSE